MHGKDSLDGTRAGILRSADQRLVAGEELLSRLNVLKDERREFGLCTRNVESLIRRFETRIEAWNLERDAFLNDAGPWAVS